MHPNNADVCTVEHSIPEALGKFDNGVTKEEANKIWYKKYEIRWAKVIFFGVFHLQALYVLATFPYVERYKSVLWAIFMWAVTSFGIGAGVHRLWSHKSFKAKLPLQILLAVCYTPNAQIPIKKWVQLHRLHHKYSDTEDDPHNSRNGFFYSHIGWALVKKSRTPIVDKYKSEKTTDVDENPVISFFDRYFYFLATVFTIISVAIPVYCWDEEWYYAYASQIARIIVTINLTFAINSIAHNFGDRPFNKYIRPADSSLMSYFTLGEGWHNYHHVFPYDYRTPELIGLRFDPTGKMIELFEKIGWAYDLRKPNEEHVKRAIRNKGDYRLQSLAN